MCIGIENLVLLLGLWPVLLGHSFPFEIRIVYLAFSHLWYLLRSLYVYHTYDTYKSHILIESCFL